MEIIFGVITINGNYDGDRIEKKARRKKRKEKRKKGGLTQGEKELVVVVVEHVPEDGTTSNNVFAVSWFCDIGNAVSSSAATLKIIFSRQVGNANDRTRAVLKAARFA